MVGASFTFLTPVGALLALTVALPLAAFAAVERRARVVRRRIGAAEPPRRARLELGAALAAVPLLLALAAAQPAIERKIQDRQRTDAQAWFVFDTSRSMSAAPSRDAATRLDRAKAEALRLRRKLQGIPVGIVSLTDRLLPHLFPTADAGLFAATVAQSVGVDRPPPGEPFPVATTFAPLGQLATRNYFRSSATHRLVVVFTDGESRPFGPELVGSGIHPLLVHVWRADEHVFTAGLAEAGYHPDPASAGALGRLARTSGGHVFAEGDVGGVARTAAAQLGRGPTALLAEQQREISLAPWVALAAFLPLGLVLLRRNVPGDVRGRLASALERRLPVGARSSP